MERDELIEEISRRKGIAMEEVAEILDEEDAICLEEEEKFVQQMKKKEEKKEDVHAWNNHNIPCRCSVCTFCP